MEPAASPQLAGMVYRTPSICLGAPPFLWGGKGKGQCFRGTGGPVIHPSSTLSPDMHKTHFFHPAGELSAAGSAMNEHRPWAYPQHETTNASSSEIREEKLLYASSHKPKAEPCS